MIVLQIVSPHSTHTGRHTLPGNLAAEQERYLDHYGRMSSRGWHKYHTYDITATDIARIQPDVIVATGPVATTWLLGEGARLEVVHGLPHYPGAFDPTIAHRSAGAIVVPIYHPSVGFASEDLRNAIAVDYGKVAKVIRGRLHPVIDAHPSPAYVDVTGVELAAMLDMVDDRPLSIDTEGTPGAPWSLQVCWEPGLSFVLRCDQPDFDTGIAALRLAADRSSTIVMHNAMYDMLMCRVMGLELRDHPIYDTQYAAYLTRTEPQGLKALAWRWCGVHMESYEDTVGDAGAERQIDYLRAVVDHPWPAVEQRVIHANDGTWKLYRPQSLDKRAKRMIADVLSGKLQRRDIYSRWRDTVPDLLEQATAELGPMIEGSLDDLPLDEAITYSARDADVTLRLYHAMVDELSRLKLTHLMSEGMEVLPIFEEMQSTGMPASRSYFENLRARMNDETAVLQSQLSSRYYGGRPFNPKSPKHVATLLRRRGLAGTKTTSTGAVSTSKDSIEYLKYDDPAIKLVFEWRERQHVRDSYCAPILARLGRSGTDIAPVRCRLKTTRVATRRLASTDPNLLAIPSRTAVGKLVRDGFICPPGYVLGAWDLSQIEMRYMAHVSRDPLLCERFINNADIHSETAATIFGVPLAEVDKTTQRTPAKTAGFGIIYGTSGAGLLTQLQKLGLTGWTEASCDDLIERWLDVYAGVRAYMEAVKTEVYRTGIVRDHWGMVRHLPGIWHDNRSIAMESGRAAVSHTVQGGAQGMIQRSMAWLRPQIRDLQRAGADVRWALQIHDELVLMFTPDLWPVLDGLVREGLTRHSGVELCVPVDADGHMSDNWGGLK